jgi:hypothetical protein
MQTWKEHLKSTHDKMKESNPRTTLRAAMLEAKKTRSPVQVQMLPKEEAVQQMPKHNEPVLHDKGVFEAYKSPFMVKFN